ncbi:hypothetical protein HYV87_00960 [Candidatus Woesearchaeota archaeon]|nr:hypothetical protein [Candidatus Woesearchaeota archaeon]
MRSKLVIESVDGFERTVVEDMCKFEGITKGIRILPTVIIAEIETDSPEKLNLFIKEQLSSSKYIKAIEPISRN